MSNPEHFLISASPMRPVPITAIVLQVTSSPRKGRYGCQYPHLFSRVRCSAGHIFRASDANRKKANSAVASVNTSAVFVNGTLERLASARLILSKPTAYCATTFSVPLPASKTSASIGSRKVVISPSIPDFTFSTMRLLGGGSGLGYTSTSYPRLRSNSIDSPISQVAKTRNFLLMIVFSLGGFDQRKSAKICGLLQILLRPLIHSSQCLIQILQRISHAETQIALTIISKCRSRKTSHARLLQQRICQLFRLPSRLRDIGEYIKRAFRQPA